MFFLIIRIFNSLNIRNSLILSIRLKWSIIYIYILVVYHVIHQVYDDRPIAFHENPEHKIIINHDQAYKLKSSCTNASTEPSYVNCSSMK